MQIITNRLPNPPKNAYCALDIEVFGLNSKQIHRPTSGTFASMQICYEPGVVYVCTEASQVQQYLDCIQDTIWLAHYSKFDLTHLRRWAKVPPRSRLIDTHLIERILWNGYYDRFSLEDLSRRYLDTHLDKSLQKKFEHATELTPEFLEYAALDAHTTLLCWNKQKKIVTAGDMKVYREIDLPALWAVMDFMPIRIDVDKWRELAVYHKQKQDEADAQLPFNIRSYKKAREYLAGCGFKGLPNVQEETLVQYIDRYPNSEAARLATIALDSKNFGTLSSKYGAKFVDDYAEQFGDIWGIVCNYNITGAETGRMSASDPPLNGIPSRDTKVFRECFVARPGNKFIKADYCLAPNTKILRADDLRWIEIKDVNVGDTLVGFDENKPKKSVTRKFRRSVVEYKNTRYLPSYQIELENGKKIVASEDHLWLVRRSGYMEYVWKKTKDLTQTDSFRLFCEPWEDDLSYESGYLAGVYDGEGSISIARGPILSFNQVEGQVLDYTIKLTQDKGFETHGPYERKGGFNPLRTSSVVYVLGVIPILRFLGVTRPKRLMKKHWKVWEGKSLNLKGAEYHRIKSISYIGDQEVIAIQTSTRTFIADGYYTHNSQQEVAISAWHAQDKKLMGIYNSGQDVFIAAAKLMFNKDIEKSDPFRDNVMKPIIHGTDYGMTEHGLARKVGCSVEEAAEMIRVLHHTFPDLARYIDKQSRIKTKVYTAAGRRAWLNPYSDQCPNNALNDPIQGGGADLLKKSFATLHREWNFDYPYPVVEVTHDEIGLDVPEHLVEPASKLAQDIMVQTANETYPGMKFRVGVTVKDSWS
jgi:DNA polymerase I-like protein with 3'-5' exonuclease and polymerase domains